MKYLPDGIVESNAALALVLALGANLTLLHLIRRHTPEFLRSYARILRIHSLADILCDSVLFLVGLQVYPLNNRLYYACKGPWKAASDEELMLQLNIAVGISVYLPVFMIPIDFVFRWMLICHDYQMSNRQLFGFTLSAFSGSMMVSFPYFRTIARTNSELFSLAEIQYFRRILEIPSTPRLGIILTGEFRTILMIFILSVLASVEYAFIGFTVWQIVGTAKRMQRPDHTNRHITRVLILQASLPLLVAAPATTTVIVSMLGTDWPMFGAVSAAMLAWLAVLRPAATIMIVPHYRHSILGYLRGRGKRRRSIAQLKDGEFGAATTSNPK